MTVDPLSHVMNVDKALNEKEERKKLIVPVNFEGPYDRLCYQMSKYGRVSLLIEDVPGRGKSTFLFTLLADGPRPTFEDRKRKAVEQGRQEPECVRNPESFDKVYEIPRRYFRSEELNALSDEELRKLLSENKNVLIDDIHTLTNEALGTLKRALETFDDMNIIATVVPPGDEEIKASYSLLSQVEDRFLTRARIDPMDPQALKKILRRRLEYALKGSKDERVDSVVENVATTIAYFATALGGYVTPRKGIILLRDYLRGELLRDLEVIVQNFFPTVNVRATMAPAPTLYRGIGQDSVEFDEMRLSSDGVSVDHIVLKEPAIVATVGYSTRHGQLRFYARIAGKVQTIRRLQVPDVIMKDIVIDPQILVMHVETSNTSSVLYPDVTPPQELLDAFGELVRNKYFELQETSKNITKITLARIYRILQSEVRKRESFSNYVVMLKEKTSVGNVELALDRLILYRSLKAISEIFPRVERV